MTGNKNAWRAPLAGLASVAMLATMGVAASTAGAVTYDPDGKGSIYNTPRFAVTFNAGSRGTVDADNTPSVAEVPAVYKGANDSDNYKVDAPTVTPQSGYTFTGWYTAAQGGDRVQFTAEDNDQGLSADAFTKDVTLYAHYAKTADELVTVKFGGQTNLYQASEVKLASGDKLADWQKPVDVADGCIINSWDADLDAPVTKSVTVSPKDVAQGALVTFDLGKGVAKVVKGSAKIELPAGGTIAAGQVPTVVTADETKIATQWFVNSDTTKSFVPGATTFAAGTTTNLTANAANSFAPAYKVGYMADQAVKDVNAPVDQSSGKSTYGFALTDAYFAANDTVTVPDVNLYDGLYKVSGWYWYEQGVGNHAFAPGSMTASKLFETSGKTGSIVLHVSLVPSDEAKFTVTFDENYGNGAITKVEVTKDQTVAVPAAPTREGYRFLGWYTTADGDEKFDFNTKITSPVTVYAHWKLTAQYDLDILLAKTNKGANGKSLYAEGSWNTWQKVLEDTAKASEGSITKQADGTYKADYTNVYLTDEKVAELTKSLRAAFAKLQYVRERAQDVFTDVDGNTPFVDDINDLYAQGVVNGYADNTFRGMSQIKRQDFAAMLYRLAGSPEFDEAKATKTFSDVTAGDNANHAKEVLWAASNGIIGGFSDGTFRGMDNIKRQDAAAMLYKLIKAGNSDPAFDPAAEGQFSDTTATSPWSKETMYLASKGVIRGYADNTFRGTNTIVRQDAAAFLNRVQTIHKNIADLYK